MNGWLVIVLGAGVIALFVGFALAAVRAGRQADEWADERQRVRDILDREAALNEKDAA